MSSLDKLLKAFESVRMTGTQNIGIKPKKATSTESGSTSGLNVEQGEKGSHSDQPNTISILASSLSQQGQNLLRKEHSLTSRDKLALCQSVSESIICGTKMGSDFLKLISIGIEALFVLLDDDNPDVRMNADEALNRVIRSLSDNHLGKIQLELFKEIKKNGSVRCLRAALVRFGLLCHHIRAQKCRAYVQNLLPYLTKIARRPEENLQETLTQCLEKILPVLGHFTNDNEIRTLLKAFLPNVINNSPSMRRSACASLVALCEHSRKPSFFFLWLLDDALQRIVPVRPDAPSHLIIGTLLLLRSVVMHLDTQRVQTDPKTPEPEFTIDKALQIYELCLHYSVSKDHNVVIASLETLQALLLNLSPHLLSAMTSPNGITHSTIIGVKSSKISSRSSSQASIIIPLAEDESLLSQMDDDGTLTLEKTSDEFQDQDSNLAAIDQILDPSNQSVDSYDSSIGPVYADIEIGQVSDCGPLLGRRDLQMGEESNIKKKRNSFENSEDSENKISIQLESNDAESSRVEGMIGSLFDQDIPLKHLVRHLSSTFLLSGRDQGLISETTIKTSAKILALNCLGLAISLQPSLVELPLFIDYQDMNIAPQMIADIFLYFSHLDPLLASNVASVVGQYIFSCLVTNDGHFSALDIELVSLSNLLNILSKLLRSQSSVTVRGAIAGLSKCLPELLHSWEAPASLDILKTVMQSASNSYWLVKVELCELLGSLSCAHVDYLEKQSLKIRMVSLKEEPRNTDQYSTRIITEVFLPLLADQDQRVRAAASKSLARLVPELFNEGNIIHKCSLMNTQSGHLSSNLDLLQSLSISTRSSKRLVAPFDKLLGKTKDPSNISGATTISLEDLIWESNDRAVSKLVALFARKLLTCNQKFLRLGCLELLSELCIDFPPVLHPLAWGCDIKTITRCPQKNDSHLGLVSLLLTLTGESSLAGDLSAQQFIVDICANWIAGRAVYILNENGPSVEKTEDKWSFLDHSQLTIIGEKFLDHLVRIMCVYMHLLEGITPTTRSTLLPPVAAAALSPIKRKTKAESIAEKAKSQSMGSTDRTSSDDKKSRIGLRGAFAHFPEYIKLYDVLKSAYTNHKMSLEEPAKEKFCNLLNATLKSLGILLELCSMNEFGRLTEELLQYFRTTIALSPSLTTFCGQQLLKCLFGSNIISNWKQLFCSTSLATSMLPISPNASFTASYRSDTVSPESLRQSLFSRSVQMPSWELKMDLNALLDGKIELEIMGLGLIKRNGASRISSRNADKNSLSSYIRMFEPLVIKALKLYTVTSDVCMQKSVLELLIHLVQIRVNYCLLDSEQIFIGYVIKQFEYIEEGQIKNCQDLIGSMFNFLVLLSYERHHSKNIIGVPKIIRLCDGLMASGQPPLSHCIVALKPLVEDLFLERSHASSVEQKELETQKEVLCSMLLRLASYYQVLHLLSIVLISTHESNKDRWRKLSRQILDVLLPLMSKLHINLESKESLSAVEGILNSVCSSVFRPPDAILKALLTSPAEIETTAGVERWVSGVILLLRVLMTRSSVDMVLARLDQLGLCMEYSTELDRSAYGLSLSPRKLLPAKNSNQQAFIDPLNVTKPSVEPQIALARFLIEVVRVCVAELKTIEFMKIQENVSSDSSRTSSKSSFLVYLTHHLLLTIIHLVENSTWDPVVTSLKTLMLSETWLVDEISDAFLFVARWHPSVSLLWCQLISLTDVASVNFWTKVLRTTRQKSDSIPSDESSDEQNQVLGCLSLEYLRQSAFLVFAEFVHRHSQEGEWLRGLVVQHVKDLVVLHEEPPVNELLHYIYSSSSASALLIQAFHARCSCFHQAKYGPNIVSIVSGVHFGQSATLTMFLVDRMISSPFLMTSRSVAALCSQRLQYMLADGSGRKLFSSGDLTKLLDIMNNDMLKNRYGQVYSLLQQLSSLKESLSPPDTSSVSTTSTLLDVKWYLQLVQNRCCEGAGGGRECSQLLSHLDYNDALLVLSSKRFNLAILPQAFRKAIIDTQQANCNWVDSESVDSSEESSVNEGSEAPLLSACKVTLMQHLSQIINVLPKPHAVFQPSMVGSGIEVKYSEKLSRLLNGQSSLVKLAQLLPPSVTQFLESLISLPWKMELDPDTVQNLLQFAVFSIEYVRWLSFHKKLDVSEASKSLKAVDLILKNSQVFDIFANPDSKSYIFSMLSSIYSLVVYWVEPKDIVSLPKALSLSLEAPNLSNGNFCAKIMQLILWFEKQGSHDIPPCLSKHLRGICIALGRTKILNSMARSPPELWTMGWSPTIACSNDVLSVPPIPVHLLQESEVLKQFIFRMNFVGFVCRQQFEETWMQYLSVLNATPDDTTPLEEIPYINLSLSLAVRGVTSLLVQTLLSPEPGNPHASSLLHLPMEKLPLYLTTKGGKKLQKVMHILHLKLQEVQYLIRSGIKTQAPYHAGQVSVQFLATPIARSEFEGCYEYQVHTKRLEEMNLDVLSCLHFLQYLYSTWLSPQSGICSTIACEVVKSMSMLCDLFTSTGHHQWILETLLPFHAAHPNEDIFTTHGVILAVCKALATLKTASSQDVSSSQTEAVLQLVEEGLKSIQPSIRTCALQGILYLLQAPQDDDSPVISIACNYINKHSDRRECESHETVVWRVWVYLVERFEKLPDPTLPSTALHMALTRAASPSVSPRILYQVLRGVERLIIVQQLSSGTVEVILKLVMDLVLHSSPADSLAALPLFVTALHSCTRTLLPPATMEDPETLVHFMEKLSVLFDRIRIGAPYEAEVLAGLLGTCLLDILPAGQMLNKVITEFISSHQPYPDLVANTLFEVFERAMSEGAEDLVHDWVLLSLSNFCQRTPIGLAVWCLTCFFIAASDHKWLRGAFPCVQSRLGRLQAADIELFCLSAIQFRTSLPQQQQRDKFDDVFKAVAAPGSPFETLLNRIQ